MLAQYIIEHRTTVRAAAKQFGISKSTVIYGYNKLERFLWIIR